MLDVFTPFHPEKFVVPSPFLTQIIQFSGQCLFVAARILSRFFSGAVWKKRAPTIRFSRMYYVPFSLTRTLSFSNSSFASLCLYFTDAAVICCDKAASTGDARVSRVEGHPPPFPARILSSPEFCPSRSRPVGGAYDIFLIILRDTRPSVTTVSRNKRLRTFFSLYDRVLAYSPTTFWGLALLCFKEIADYCICTTEIDFYVNNNRNQLFIIL